ncbi:hypothetical protein LSH36_663g01002 [Paralvinella palmiformis]|uniref:Uncharacterized protein n=1 Tax=Paralvinella palmiformis TaxID=53620 RepID=A0AAD9J4X7_9ANNE|nr:hypothetical protein LSH36_663g01002 [Paralvinella palmiformis]
MADVRAPQITTSSGVVSSTPSNTNIVVAAASAPNVANSSCGTRPKDTPMNVYAMPQNVALPPLPNDKAEHEEADDDFILQPAHMKRQSYVKVQKMTPTIGEKYLWYKAKKDNITMYQDILDERLGDVIGAPPWSSGSVLDHGSLPPVFESRRGHI